MRNPQTQYARDYSSEDGVCEVPLRLIRWHGDVIEESLLDDFEREDLGEVGEVTTPAPRAADSYREVGL